MVEFKTVIKKFNKNGEKSGWTYIEIPEEIILKIKGNYKKSFRVKGFIDKTPIAKQALLPMGGGIFIMALNAVLRKAICKKSSGISISKGFGGY